MRPLSSTAIAPLEFILKTGELSKKVTASTNKIGWIHSVSDKPGAKFDLVIKDALGREKVRKTGCGNETEKYGELVNIPTMMGEELHVEIENLKNAESLKIFLN